jgi:Cysteine dioxygenase type I
MPPSAEVGPADLEDIARSVAQRRGLWEDELRRTTVERTFVDVFSNDHLGVWVISWMDEVHDTGFHDHATSCGAVFVVEGAIRHEHLRLGQRPQGLLVPAGEAFCFDNTFIHRMRKEPGASSTVTIHAYSPPLTATGQLGEGDDGLLHRWPTPSEEQLKPHGDQGTPSTQAGGTQQEATGDP